MAVPLMDLPRVERRAAKERLVTGMLTGLSWRAAAEAAGITVTADTAHRLRRRARQEGVVAFDDRRHGVPYKLPPSVRAWIVTYCHAHPHTPSRVLQMVLRDTHDLRVSIGYLNQVRATLGVGFQRPPPEKKGEPHP